MGLWGLGCWAPQHASEHSFFLEVMFRHIKPGRLNAHSGQEIVVPVPTEMPSPASQGALPEVGWQGFRLFGACRIKGQRVGGLSESDSSRISSSGFRNEGLAGPWLVGSGPLCLGR